MSLLYIVPPDVFDAMRRPTLPDFAEARVDVKVCRLEFPFS